MMRTFLDQPMFGVSRRLWPLILVSAAPLLWVGCGGSVDPNTNTQFRPVDDEEMGSGKTSDPNPGVEIAAQAKSNVLPPQAADEPRFSKGITSRGTSDQGNATKAASKETSSNKPSSSASKGTTGRKPADTEVGSGDDPALAGPSGSKIRRLRKLLQSLGGKLEGDTQEARMQYLMSVLQQTMMTADEIVADERVPAEARDEALFARFQVASMMLQVGPEEESKEVLTQVATDLSNADNKRFATLGRVQLFKLHVLDVLKLQPADASEVLTALDTLLAAGGDIDVITSEIMPLVRQLEQFGYAKDSVAAIAKIGDHYAASMDQSEAIIGKQLQASALVGQLRNGEGDVEKIGEQLVAKVQDVVEASKGDKGGVNFLYQLAFNQEGDFPQVAGKLYDLLEEKYADNSDETVANKVKELLTSARQRMGLVGNPLQVTGILVGGDPFDWSEYQGKVVLVHFWALSSQASLQDISDKDRLHRKYARRGLKLVGVNLDVKIADVERLFEAQELSWPTVTGENPAQRGFKHPTAQACGVTAEALPYSVLIGKDGKVAAAGLQGPPLDEAIVKLLAAKAKPAEKNASEDTPADESQDTEQSKKNGDSVKDYQVEESPK